MRRIVLTFGLIAGAVLSAIMLLTLTSRHTLDLDVIRDRNPDYDQLADGAVRNGYTLKLMDAIDASANSLARAYEEMSVQPFWVPELPAAAA